MFWTHYQLASMGTVVIPTPTLAWLWTETAGPGGWTWPCFVVIPLLLTAALYGIGTVKMLRRQNRETAFVGRIVCFALGWISVVIALDSPLHEIGEQLFWVHMTQHEVLMLISAPLLVLGQPLFYFLWALPSTWRECAANLGRSVVLKTVWKMISAPLSAWL